MPPPDSQSDTITLRGEQAKLGPALTLVYAKVNCFMNLFTVHLEKYVSVDYTAVCLSFAKLSTFWKYKWSHK